MKLNDTGHLLIGCETNLVINAAIIAGVAITNPTGPWAFAGALAFIHATVSIAAALLLIIDVVSGTTVISQRHFAWYVISLLLCLWTLTLSAHLARYTIKHGMEHN